MNLWEFAFHIMKSLCLNFPLVLFIFELLAMLRMTFSKLERSLTVPFTDGSRPNLVLQNNDKLYFT